jgi:glycosyltransferase involved in cell wall biosynthesis
LAFYHQEASDLKIAWFTPFHLQSAIGQVSKLVCEELQKACSVDIYTFDRANRISTSVNVINFVSSNFHSQLLDSYDHVVYSMGNFAGNHGEIWEVMQRYPGILLLHDQVMQNFFAQVTMFPEYGGNPRSGAREYVEIMRNVYGLPGEAAAKTLYGPYSGEQNIRLWGSEVALAYPLIEPLLSKSTAVFSHASFMMRKIADHFYGPTGYAYLPFVPGPPKSEAVLPVEFKDASKTLIVSTGIVHPVKRIDRVAEMLIANPDIAKGVCYAVIGSYGGPYGEHLASLAQGPLKGCLYLLGYRSDDVMEAFLDRADFCINLRYPNSEVCSKSLIDQMAYKNPVIVLNSGIFAEMPDDCVIKISRENETVELEHAFRFLLEDPERCSEIARRAANFIEQNCTPKIYASRFLSFLERITPTIAANQLVHQTVRINRQALSELSFNEQSAPWAIEAIRRQLTSVVGAIPPAVSDQKTLGIWLGFPYKLSLRREGITKFLLYMLLALLEEYPISCELWTYSINEEEICASFDALLNEKVFQGRVKVVTEQNFTEVLDVPSYKAAVPMTVNETLDNLADLAREYSQATAFVTAIVYLDNVIGTGKPLFVPVHDLSIHVHYDDFVAKDPLYKVRHVDIRSRAENLARSGAFMFSNSEYVRREQVLRYISSLDPTCTEVVYLPVNIPKNLKDNLLDEKALRQKFKLKRGYIFYPTQIRPYKNVAILVEALHILLERNMDLDLVLTGLPSDVPEVYNAIKKHNLHDRVISLSTVAENELYSLYRYAAAAAVPTLFEGGFPWQACEALFMDTPLALSDISIVRERIEFHGMSMENCGLQLFTPNDPLACANALEKIIRNREAALLSQRAFRDKFLSYSWKDAVAHYYRLFFGSPEN